MPLVLDPLAVVHAAVRSGEFARPVHLVALPRPHIHAAVSSGACALPVLLVGGKRAHVDATSAIFTQRSRQRSLNVNIQTGLGVCSDESVY